MNLNQVLEYISNSFMTGQIEQKHLPLILADVASKTNINMYQLIEHINDLANENRSDESNTFLGYAYMAYFGSLFNNHI
jgi:hypothetical protein